MSTQIIEGTFLEVQQRLKALRLKPEAHLRVVVTEPEAVNAADLAEFGKTRGRNGFIMLPFPDLTTLEEVQEALYRADLEDGRLE